MKILLDAMGGDNAPEATIKGAVKAINQIQAEVVLIGKEEKKGKKKKRKDDMQQKKRNQNWTKEENEAPCKAWWL